MDRDYKLRRNPAWICTLWRSPGFRLRQDTVAAGWHKGQGSRTSTAGRVKDDGALTQTQADASRDLPRVLLFAKETTTEEAEAAVTGDDLSDHLQRLFELQQNNVKSFTQTEMEKETQHRIEVGAAAATERQPDAAAAMRQKTFSREGNPFASSRGIAVNFTVDGQDERERERKKHVLAAACPADAAESIVTLAAQNYVIKQWNIAAQRLRQQQEEIDFAAGHEKAEAPGEISGIAKEVAVAAGGTKAAAAEADIQKGEKRRVVRGGHADNTVSLTLMQQQHSTEEAPGIPGTPAAAVAYGRRTPAASNSSRGSMDALNLSPSSRNLQTHRSSNRRNSGRSTTGRSNRDRSNSVRNSSGGSTSGMGSNQRNGVIDLFSSAVSPSFAIAAALFPAVRPSPVASPLALSPNFNAGATEVVVSAASTGSGASGSVANASMRLEADAPAGGLDAFEKSCRSSAAAADQDERTGDSDEKKREYFAELKGHCSFASAQITGASLTVAGVASAQAEEVPVRRSIVDKEEKGATATAAGERERARERRGEEDEESEAERLDGHSGFIVAACSRGVSSVIVNCRPTGKSETKAVETCDDVESNSSCNRSVSSNGTREEQNKWRREDSDSMRARGVVIETAGASSNNESSSCSRPPCVRFHRPGATNSSTRQVVAATEDGDREKRKQQQQWAELSRAASSIQDKITTGAAAEIGTEEGITSEVARAPAAATADVGDGIGSFPQETEGEVRHLWPLLRPQTETAEEAEAAATGDTRPDKVQHLFEGQQNNGERLKQTETKEGTQSGDKQSAAAAAAEHQRDAAAATRRKNSFREMNPLASPKDQLTVSLGVAGQDERERGRKKHVLVASAHASAADSSATLATEAHLGKQRNVAAQSVRHPQQPADVAAGGEESEAAGETARAARGGTTRAAAAAVRGTAATIQENTVEEGRQSVVWSGHADDTVSLSVMQQQHSTEEALDIRGAASVAASCGGRTAAAASSRRDSTVALEVFPSSKSLQNSRSSSSRSNSGSCDSRRGSRGRSSSGENSSQRGSRKQCFSSAVSRSCAIAAATLPGVHSSPVTSTRALSSNSTAVSTDIVVSTAAAASAAVASPPTGSLPPSPLMCPVLLARQRQQQEGRLDEQQHSLNQQEEQWRCPQLSSRTTFRQKEDTGCSHSHGETHSIAQRRLEVCHYPEVHPAVPQDVEKVLQMSGGAVGAAEAALLCHNAATTHAVSASYSRILQHSLPHHNTNAAVAAAAPSFLCLSAEASARATAAAVAPGSGAARAASAAAAVHNFSRAASAAAAAVVAVHDACGTTAVTPQSTATQRPSDAHASSPLIPLATEWVPMRPEQARVGPPASPLMRKRPPTAVPYSPAAKYFTDPNAGVRGAEAGKAAAAIAAATAGGIARTVGDHRSYAELTAIASSLCVQRDNSNRTIPRRNMGHAPISRNSTSGTEHRSTGRQK